MSSILIELLLLAHSFVPARVTSLYATELAVAIAHAAVAEKTSFEIAKVETVWAVRESGGDARKVSADGLDCGLLQLRGVARRGYDCATLRASGELTARVWLRDLADLQARCGSTFAALGALATGKCGGAPKLVRTRCAAADVDCEKI